MKTETHPVYGVHSEPPKTQQNTNRRLNVVLTRQKCGRTRHGHFSGFAAIRPLRGVTRSVNTARLSRTNPSKLRAMSHDRRSIAFGTVALALFATRETVFAFRSQSENGLWACYVALLLIGVGLMVRSAACTAVGTFWLTVGLPLWVIDLLAAGGTESTSALTSGVAPPDSLEFGNQGCAPGSHISGVILGYAGMKRLGLPSRTWVLSILGMAVLIIISRPLTTARRTSTPAIASTKE